MCCGTMYRNSWYRIVTSQIITNLFIPSSRFVHKVKLRNFMMNNPTVYFRLVGGSDRFQVVLPYEDKSLNSRREFNFDRRLSEPLDVFLGRMRTNVEKLLSNKRKKKVKNQPDVAAFQINVEVLKDGVPVLGSDICKDVFFDGKASDLRLRLNDIDYLVSINCPWVSSISLPSNMMAGYLVFPAKLELLFCQKNDCLFHWYRVKSDDKNKNLALDSVEWEDVATGFLFTPRSEDIGYHLKLKCTPSDGKVNGPPAEAISPHEVGAGPGLCPFETRHLFTSSRLKENE